MLDIDGVMVPAKPWSPLPLLDDGFYMFNPKSVEALNNIISQSNADVVLTTSHKINFSLKKWAELFNNRGVKLKGLSRLPQNINNLKRSEEILDWFSTYTDIQNFVIIDDDSSLNGLPNNLKDRLVLTKPLIGLTESYVKDALRIMNTPLKLD